MSRDTEALLEAFEHIPADERRAFTEEVFRRSLPFDSGPLANEEIAAPQTPSANRSTNKMATPGSARKVAAEVA